MMNEALHDFFAAYPDLRAQNRLAIGVSGGPDSMALAHALIHYFSDKEIHILSVNHGLRVEAVDEIRAVKEWAEQFQNVHFLALEWKGDKPDNAIMEAARHARYGLMADHCQAHNIKALYIGHHQDDQAETFLIRLSKGSGLDGLAAMQPVAEYGEEIVIARPLLDLSKDQIIVYCDMNSLPFIQDPSNQNEDYLRPRLRAARDLLEEEGLSSKRLAVAAKRMTRARTALETMAQNLCDQALIDRADNQMTLNADDLMSAPEELSLRVLKIAMEMLQPAKEYATRFEKLEDLHKGLCSAYSNNQSFKKRSLGHCFFSYALKNKQIIIEKE